MIRPIRVALAAALALTLAATGAASAAAAPPASSPTGADLPVNRAGVDPWTADTWRSMAAMADPATGLPADNIDGNLSPESRARYTSPTNIGAYIWSAISARKLNVISEREQVQRISHALDSLAELPRHPDSGMFYNWYDPSTLQVLHTWPENGSAVYPFASSVDNAWLAAALMIVHNAVPQLRPKSDPLLKAMDFGFFYDSQARGPDVPAGLMRGGFWVEPPPGCATKGNYEHRGPDVYYTCHTYGAFNSETRMISYVAIALGQVPPAHYFAPWRTFPDTCDWSWQEMRPVGQWREYLGVPVFEGAYRYRGLQFVPTWGGDMFEALMPNLFVPEEQWGPDSWARNHPVYVRGQIEHGMNDAKYGHWGFSPASDPQGGYREYGVDAMGLDTNGYTSDQERTSVDYGFAGCPDRPAQPTPTAYGDGVVTPHAVFLAMRYAPAQAQAELARLRSDFDSYGPGGFYDSVAVRSGTVAKRYLALDQGMIMAALGNLYGGDVLRKEFSRGGAEQFLQPVMRVEEFSVPASQ
ncbi:glucoamylase family protein [Micromonospora sp. NPDC050200]|uniref:glucoamylase family protein n=1 Tax=Micromonospora sp. NPDC050200 TaxID=3155664 RepID=UPI0033DBB15D